MKYNNLIKFIGKDLSILYPSHAFEKCQKMDVGTTLAITCNINTLDVPSIIIKCNEEALQNFGITFPPAQPKIQFRMLDFEQKDFLIEIVLHFDNGKKLRLHFDPSNNLVRHFLKQLVKTAMISFHFYSADSNVFITTITTIGGDEIDWAKRNIELARNLNSNNKSSMISEYLLDHSPKSTNDQIYTFEKSTDKSYLSLFATKFVKMGHDKTYHDVSK